MGSEYIVNWLIHSESISQKDKEIYLYGIRLLFAITLNIFASLFIGVLLHMITETIFLLCILFPLRINAGGFHASSYTKCFVLSCLLLLGSLILIKFLKTENGIYMSIIMISTIIISFLSPVEDKNKPLEEIEKKVYGHRTRIMLVVYIMIACLFYACRSNKYLCIESVTLVIISTSLILGSIKNYLNKNISRRTTV